MVLDGQGDLFGYLGGICNRFLCFTMVGSAGCLSKRVHFTIAFCRLASAVWSGSTYFDVSNDRRSMSHCLWIATSRSGYVLKGAVGSCNPQDRGIILNDLWFTCLEKFSKSPVNQGDVAHLPRPSFHGRTPRRPILKNVRRLSLYVINIRIKRAAMTQAAVRMDLSNATVCTFAIAEC